MIETSRLKIFVASEEQMKKFIDLQTIDELKIAYNEMLNGSLMHKDEWEWYAMWMIELKDGTHIGELCFKGVSKDGVVEIGYGIIDKYQGNGYATDAVNAVVNWALNQPGISCVKAETDEFNIASKKVLKKVGFKITDERGEEGSIFIYKKDNKFIAYCGLDCEKCEARIATINNDEKLREKVAKEWSKLNGIEITKDMINCEGCRIDGIKTPFCDKLCEIKKCASEKQYETCGNCRMLLFCDKIKMIINNNKVALENLNKK